MLRSSPLTTNSPFLWTPGFHTLITVYFHVEIYKRPCITLPPLDCISLLIYTVMMLVLCNGKGVLPTPQISANHIYHMMFIKLFLHLAHSKTC